MTEASPQSSRNAWRERVQALKNVPPVLGILWESGPAVVTWGIILRIFVAALPAAIAGVAAKIINGVQHVFSHQGLIPYFWWLVGLEAGLNVFSGLLTRGVDYSDSLLADRYTHFVSVQVMQQAAQLDLTTYEDPVFYDRLERARVQSTASARSTTTSFLTARSAASASAATITRRRPIGRPPAITVRAGLRRVPS